MKKYLIILLLLSGCQTVPIEREFPKVFPELLNACPNLVQVKDTEKMSEVLYVVVQNYSLYHECKAKVDSWVIWYNEQKKAFSK